MDIAALEDEVEAVSVFYAERHDIARTDDWFMLKFGEEVGVPCQYLCADDRNSGVVS